ncbi:MAG: hypothetical protein IBX36_02890 [Dehalococcoidia bacterium]|nr:hypothetical protein [Dehalococcoidia bacterium]
MDDTKVKTISLCGGSGACPMVKIGDEQVEIGEEGNLCILTKSQWETLKQKILNQEA